MGWALIVIGAVNVVAGVIYLLRAFRGGLSDRAVARTDAPQQLVQPAVMVTFGLFLAFFGIANVVAERMGAS